MIARSVPGGLGEYMGVLEAIGGTPLVEIEKLNPFRDKVRVLAKLEGANPCGSVKDRIAKKMLLMAVEKGDLTLGKTVLEATSGNAGIGLAMTSAAMGFGLTLTMPESVSLERRSLLQALGATIVLTPSSEGADGAVREAARIMESDPDKYFMPNRFDNPYNFLVHYETTGPEIWDQTGGEVTHFVAGVGTSGTLMGVSRYLKEKEPKVRAIAVEPVKGHHIPGLKNMEESMCPGLYYHGRIDRTIMVRDEGAFEYARRLAMEEGLLVGISSGAALWGALEAARDLAAGSTLVLVFPDGGDRYLSTHLFGSRLAKFPP